MKLKLSPNAGRDYRLEDGALMPSSEAHGRCRACGACKVAAGVTARAVVRQRKHAPKARPTKLCRSCRSAEARGELAERLARLEALRAERARW